MATRKEDTESGTLGRLSKRGEDAITRLRDAGLASFASAQTLDGGPIVIGEQRKPDAFHLKAEAAAGRGRDRGGAGHGGSRALRVPGAGSLCGNRPRGQAHAQRRRASRSFRAGRPTAWPAGAVPGDSVRFPVRVLTFPDVRQQLHVRAERIRPQVVRDRVGEGRGRYRRTPAPPPPGCLAPPPVWADRRRPAQPGGVGAARSPAGPPAPGAPRRGCPHPQRSGWPH